MRNDEGLIHLQISVLTLKRPEFLHHIIFQAFVTTPINLVNSDILLIVQVLVPCRVNLQ